MKAPSKQQASAEERALKDVATSSWNVYTSSYIPAEAALAKTAEMKQGEVESIKGQANADTAAAFKGMARQTQVSHQISGADEQSGKSKFALAGDAEAQGKATGLTKAGAKTNLQISKDQQKLGVVAIGRDQASGAIADMSANARRTTRLALAARDARQAKNSALIMGAATVAGAAARKFDVFGLDDKQPETIE